MSKINTAISGAAAGGSVGGPWGAAIGGAAGFLLGQDDQSQDYMSKALQAAQGIPLPVLKEYYPELYKQVVTLNPEMETAVNLGPSQMQGIATDPSLRQAQMAALQKLQSVGSANGMDSQSQANLMQIQNDVNTNNRGNQDAILQNMATRGVGGGGQEMVARSIAAQEASNRGGQMAMEAKSQAEQRALQAIMQSGQLGGQMQSQDFNQQQAKAQAADTINKFNAQNTQQVMNNNITNKNNAQQWNAQNLQSTTNQNTGLSNQAQMYNSNLAQQQYDNQMKKTGMVTGTLDSAAKASQAAATNQDNFLGNLASSGATAYAANQKKKQPGEV